VRLAVDGEHDPIVYRVEGDLKRPGEAIQRAKDRAAADGHEGAELETVELAEPV
jgi:hypothetical protein